MSRVRRERRGWSAAAFGSLVVAIALALVPAATASAHDVLISTSPADGDTVGATPAQVTLTFDQPALKVGTALKITGPSGEVTEGVPTLVDDEVHQAVAAGAPAGRYRVDWRVTSADGHPVSGTFSFTSTAAGIGQADSSAATQATPKAAASASSSSPWPWLLALALVLVVAVAVTTQVRRRRGPAPDEEPQEVRTR